MRIVNARYRSAQTGPAIALPRKRKRVWPTVGPRIDRPAVVKPERVPTTPPSGKPSRK